MRRVFGQQFDVDELQLVVDKIFGEMFELDHLVVVVGQMPGRTRRGVGRVAVIVGRVAAITEQEHGGSGVPGEVGFRGRRGARRRRGLEEKGAHTDRNEEKDSKILTRESNPRHQ